MTQFFGLSIKQLPDIRPTVFQFGKIDVNVKTKGFWRKKTDTEYFANAKKIGNNNLFLSNTDIYEKTERKLDAIFENLPGVTNDEKDDDSQEENNDDTKSQDSKQSRNTVMSEGTKFKNNKDFEKVDADQNFSEDIPNL